MWNRIKNWTTIFVGGAITGILLFLQFKSGEDSVDALEEANLAGQEKIIDQDIASIEKDLDNIDIEDLSPDDVKDFWENL